jgi:hypothetical protein
VWHGNAIASAPTTGIVVFEVSDSTNTWGTHGK